MVDDADLTDLETQVVDLQQLALRKVSSSVLGEAISASDQTITQIRSQIIEAEKTIDQARGELLTMRTSVASRKRPYTYAITGGQTTYYIEHNLGYYPVVQLLTKNLTTDTSQHIQHMSKSKIKVVVSSNSYEGTVLYL